MSATYAEAALTAADRCDRCGAQAYVRATMGPGLELLFCMHHWRDNEARLREVATSIYDESTRLSDVPAAAVAEER